MSNLNLPTMTYKSLKDLLFARPLGHTKIQLSYKTVDNASWHSVTTASRIHAILSDNKTGHAARIRGGRMVLIGGGSVVRTFGGEVIHFSRSASDNGFVLHENALASA